MEKVKIGIDEGKFNDCEYAINEYLKLFESLKKEYNKLGLRPLKNEDLSKVLTGENFIKDVILEGSENATVGTLKLSKAKMRELVELPVNTGVFIMAVNELVNFNKENRVVPVFLSDFEIKGEKIVFQNSSEVINDRCSVWITGVEQIEYFNVIKSICDILNACKHPHQFIGNQNTLFVERQQILCMEGVYVPNVEFLRRRQ